MKHPGTSGSMPIKGTGCGIRPDLDKMSIDTSFDFSKAKEVLEKHQTESQKKESDNQQRPTN